MEEFAFELKMIKSLLKKAVIPFKNEDIHDIDTEGYDRIYFKLGDDPKWYIIRTWEYRKPKKMLMIDYTLYKDNDHNSADEIISGTYRTM